MVAVAWVIVERRIPNPMVDQTVFWSRPMWVNNAVSVLAGFGLFGALVATSTFAQMPGVPGLGGLNAGPVNGAWVVVPCEWFMILIGPLTGYWSRWMGKGPSLIGGAVFGAFLTSDTLPGAAGAPPLPSVQAFEAFWAWPPGCASWPPASPAFTSSPTGPASAAATGPWSAARTSPRKDRSLCNRLSGFPPRQRPAADDV